MDVVLAEPRQQRGDALLLVLGVEIIDQSAAVLLE